MMLSCNECGEWVYVINGAIILIKKSERALMRNDTNKLVFQLCHFTENTLSLKDAITHNMPSYWLSLRCMQSVRNGLAYDGFQAADVLSNV